MARRAEAGSSAAWSSSAIVYIADAAWMSKTRAAWVCTVCRSEEFGTNA